MNVLDARGTERAFRTAITTIGYVRSHVTKLVDSDRSTPDVLQRLDDITSDLESDREALRDWLRA